MPQLLKDAQRSIDFKVCDNDELAAGVDEDDEKKGIQSLQVKVKGMEGAKQVSINTSSLEVKTQAVEILKNITRNLGTSFFDYVEDVAKVCLEELICDPLTSQIRR